MKPWAVSWPFDWLSKSPVNEPFCAALSQPSTLTLRALVLVVLGHAVREAVHEDRHRRDRGAAERRHRAGLRVARRGVAGQVGRLRGVEHQRLDVGQRDRVVVDDREVGLGVGLGRRLGGVREQEPDGDDDSAVLRDQAVDVRRVGVLVRGLDLDLLEPISSAARSRPAAPIWLNERSLNPPASETMQALKSAFWGKVCAAAALVPELAAEVAADEDALLDAALVLAALLDAAALLELEDSGALPQAARTRPAAATLAISLTPCARRTVDLLLDVGPARGHVHGHACRCGRAALRGPYSGVGR